MFLSGIFVLLGRSGRRRRPFHHVEDVRNHLNELASNLRGGARALQNVTRPPFPRVLPFFSLFDRVRFPLARNFDFRKASFATVNGDALKVRRERGAVSSSNARLTRARARRSQTHWRWRELIRRGYVVFAKRFERAWCVYAKIVYMRTRRDETF